MKNPIHQEVLDRCRQLHDLKSHDYAQEDNVYSNFEYAAQVAAPFTDPVDKVFAMMIGVKLARLAELRKGKVPKNEPIEDSFVDLTNYAALFSARTIGKLRGEEE